MNQQQIYWLVERLYQLYDSAIAADGDVSLGRGVELYRAVEKKLIQDLDTPDQNHRYNLVTRLIAIYRTANNKKLAGVADDLRHFAFHRLPEVLKRQTNNYTSMVSETANALHDIAGPRDGLKFLVERIDAEPDWFRLNNQDGWSQYCYTLGAVADRGQGSRRGGEAALGDRAQRAPPRPAIAATAQPHHLYDKH